MAKPEAASLYWRRNLRLIAALLAVWLAVTLLVGLWGPAMRWRLFGWPLGYWMASQGALVVYCVLVAVYAAVMNRLDDDAAVDD